MKMGIPSNLTGEAMVADVDRTARFHLALVQHFSGVPTFARLKVLRS
jgi:hypothetical protein